MPDKTFKQVEEVEAKKREDGTVPPKYTEEEAKYRAKVIGRLQRAKEMRDCSHKEFDGMDYLSSYETNLQADMNFIPPKLNKQDVRVVAGTTREKDNSLLSALLNYNFEATITAFDKHEDELQELGSTMEDLVRKSREMEDYDAKRALIYRELLVQGDAFVLEEWVQKTRFGKKARFDWKDGVKFKGFDMTTKLELDYERAEVTLIPGTKVFMGNIKEPEFRNQPYAFTVETVSYDDARTRFMNWERWENVPRSIVRTQDTMDAIGYRDWTLLTSKDDYVEVIKYFDKPNNEFMLMLNGVMMLPSGFPLEEISPSGEYPIVKGSSEQIPFFAYSKSVPAKTKVEQAVMDEMLKMAVIKSQQGYNPALANNTARELSAAMWMPGAITDDVDPEKIKPLFPQGGVTSADMAMLDYIKGIIDSKSISAAFTGDKTGGQQTATEVMELKKQTLMKLGLVVWGVVQFERQLNWMRIHTIVKNWTGKDDSRAADLQGEVTEAYRRVTVDTTLEGGQKGKKIYEFNAEKANEIHPDQLRIEEELLSLKEGMPVRKAYINPKVLRNLEVVWRVDAVPTEKDTSDLHRVLFIQNLKDAAILFGPQSINMDYAKQRYATLIKENPDKFFLKPEQAMVPPLPATGVPVGGPIGQQVQQGVPQPGLNALTK